MDHLERASTECRASGLSRRNLLKRAAALGLTGSGLAGLLAACTGSAPATAPTAAPAAPSAPTSAPPSAPAAASSPSPAAVANAPSPAAAAPQPSPAAAAPPAASPAAAAPGRGRGKGDLLRILYWQPQRTLNPHYGETQVAGLVLEPLTQMTNDGTLVPTLAAELPSIQNGGVAADGSSVTYKLRRDVVWSDGEPFKADDVRFTWQYASNPEVHAQTIARFTSIKDVEVVDDFTVRIVFKTPTAAWYLPFSGNRGGQVLPKHLLQDVVGANASTAPFNLKPIGTGPYKVVDYRPGDVAVFEVNDRYRVADKPFFRRVEFKGGGDAVSAARAVLQTGEADYTFFLQVERTVLDQMLSSNPRGELLVVDGNNIEAIMLNVTDPNVETDGERSKLGVPHPFQADRAVRQAFTYLIDRDTIANQLYGPLGKPTANALVAPPKFVSKNTSYEFNPAKAAQMLDKAGWTVQNGVRQKNGVQMRLVFQTSVSPLRQKEQEIIKQAVEGIGIPVELKTIDGSIFFSSEAGNPQTLYHFYADWQMLSNGPFLPYPLEYLAFYKSNDPATDIAQKSNGWSGRNAFRWVNEEFNRLYTQAEAEFDPEKQVQLFTRMNDLIVKEDVVQIPIVARATVSAKTKKLQGPSLTNWSTDVWNIQDWYFED